MQWEGDALVVQFWERTSPRGRPLRGRVVFRPLGPATEQLFLLDDAGAHRWWPIHPAGRIDVELDEPALRFSGRGYHDANAGDVPLERTFSEWSWSRAHVDDQTLITYDVRERSGAARSVAIAFDDRGSSPVPLVGLRGQPLRSTAWRIRRRTSAGSGFSPRVVRELEDTPFYARSLIRAELGGRITLAMHEMLSLERFERSWVRYLLRFRMGDARG